MKKSISPNTIHLLLDNLLKAIKANVEGIDILASLYSGYDEKFILYSQGFANNIQIYANIIIEFLRDNPEMCHKKCNSTMMNFCKTALDDTEDYFIKANKTAVAINPKDKDGIN